jgi:hypothetical protein
MMIGAAIAYPIILGFLWVAAPGGSQPMFPAEPRVLGIIPADALIPIVGLTTYLVGFAWMLRIYRTSHLEPERTGWRYRDF